MEWHLWSLSQRVLCGRQGKSELDLNSIITTEFLVFRVGVFRFTEVSSDFIPFFLGVLRVECFKCCSPEGIIFPHK